MHAGKYGLAVPAVVLTLLVFMAGCTGNAPASTTTVAATPVSNAGPITPQVTTTSIPNLVGLWTGTATGHNKADGFRESNASRYNITVQKGSAFTGYRDYIRADGTAHYENFSGVIAHDGKISIAGHVAGTLSGDLISTNELELTLLQPGDDAKALILHLTRKQG